MRFSQLRATVHTQIYKHTLFLYIRMAEEWKLALF